jgi:hypothetical protein
MRRYRPMRALVYSLVLVGLGGAPGYARHGELPNRIPEAAPYRGGGYQYSAGRQQSARGGDAGHDALDGAGGATGGRSTPTAKAGRGAAHVNAYRAPMRWSGKPGRACSIRTPARAVGMQGGMAEL